MNTKKLINIFVIFLTFFITANSNTNLSVNSINALRNQKKEIEIKYEDKSVKVDIKTLRHKEKLNKVLNQSIFVESKLNKVELPQIVKEKGRYIVKKGFKKKTINMNHLVLASLVSDSVELKINTLNEGYTEQEAQKLADKLNKVKRQELRIHTNGKSEILKIDPLSLFENNSNNVDLNKLKEILNKYESQTDNLVSNVYVNSVTNESSGFLKDGRKINYSLTAQNFKDNLSRGLLRIEIQYDTLQAMVIDENNKKYRYEKQGEGKSNFKGSDWGRSQNVINGTNNIIANLHVMPNEQVSFLKLLKQRGATVNWKLAKVIKEGGKLESEPGGGLCQVSTTLFRAALQSGMQIDQWRNHSLYISYYKEYNNGLDSTIYAPYVDLKFTNNYNFPVLFQSYTNENQDVITEIYSPSKLDDVELVGPFYKGDVEGLRGNQILWQRKTNKFINSTVEDFLSSYNTPVRK